uniref:Uncharacterized protein n=1 Tax=Erythrolobus madagascarensis TaxID=708628 RepID=A0A7S0T890_9RHOD|mmetsp:Transcript_4786/g.10226  ORF Transcript_4786/g.10226 Transcript_4786/m.10226 type:complete len:214 (+) Transcript_4786:157-798(+)|eukprot:CAMPEP_0185851488 /NCGR_PEP_ID=MMETSP1354-20130828/9954_1 /TAXON_ID=708628 /ORGANISM="Erythrolobus madagascarensis, Strain CCMP3276" /LENGTH=213 /DNA_ID=CAMNT_0028552485 /DNA_START=123 /DNA_END=767 /DNA_ORIENTATION=-
MKHVKKVVAPLLKLEPGCLNGDAGRNDEYSLVKAEFADGNGGVGEEEMSGNVVIGSHSPARRGQGHVVNRVLMKTSRRTCGGGHAEKRVSWEALYLEEKRRREKVEKRLGKVLDDQEDLVHFVRHFGAGVVGKRLEVKWSTEEKTHVCVCLKEVISTESTPKTSYVVMCEDTPEAMIFRETSSREEKRRKAPHLMDRSWTVDPAVDTIVRWLE